YKLGAGVVLVRKPGKLPHKTHRASYTLEYGEDSLEIHQDAIEKGQKVIIADDLLATGGTARAVAGLVERMGGDIIECAFIVELGELKGRDKLKPHPVFSLLKY
ncbi:MAG: adenine phosphoribosyltransferase, partial [Deltaproteobacteria bacterium]|nr:adenine phosphoribosyltransferase [Deltaproteobacteria bacterium]